LEQLIKEMEVTVTHADVDAVICADVDMEGQELAKKQGKRQHTAQCAVVKKS
jgi:hypothetical protein